MVEPVVRDRVRGGGARSFVICIVILFSLSFVLRFRLSKTTMFYSIQNTKTKPNVRLSFPTGTAHTRHVSLRPSRRGPRRGGQDLTFCHAFRHICLAEPIAAAAVHATRAYAYAIWLHPRHCAECNHKCVILMAGTRHVGTGDAQRVCALRGAAAACGRAGSLISVMSVLAQHRGTAGAQPLRGGLPERGLVPM
jgi:hypothetical protein